MFTGPQRKAFLDYLIEMTDDDKGGFTEEELRQEVDTFIIAVSYIYLRGLFHK